jgi:hypothetical protein
MPVNKNSHKLSIAADTAFKERYFAKMPLLLVKASSVLP